MMPVRNNHVTSGSKLTIILICLIAGIFFSVLLLITVVGRSGRIFASIPGKQTVIVNTPEDAYKRWRGVGQRGRVVISASRWLNFVEIDSLPIIPTRNPKPLKVTNLARGAEKQLSSENFLNVALLNGIVREVIHVVPEAEYSDRVAAVHEVEGASTHSNDILVPHFGSPRRITTLKGLNTIGEPVLLYLNASFFRYNTPEEVLEQLKNKGLRPDDTVLCLSVDDAEVTQSERDRLLRFADLAGSAGQ